MWEYVGVAADSPTLERELTLRAVAAGLLIGAVLAVGNIYLSLKAGWWDSGAIAASILGFSLLTPLARLLGSPYGRLENNITQTTAVAVGAMPSAMGLLGAVPALELMGHQLPLWSLVLWGLVLGTLGVVVGFAFHRRFLVDKGLPFPTAIATAEVIGAMHAGRQAATGRTRALAGTALVAMVVGWFRDGKPAFIPGSVWFPGRLGGVSAESLSLGFTVSPMLLFAGHLVGPHIGWSLLLGAVTAWIGLAPLLVKSGVVAQASYPELVSWLIWPGAALMVSSSLTSFFASWRSLARAFGGRSRERETAPAQPGRWRPAAAVILCAVAVVLAGWVVFGIHPALGALVVGLSILLLVVCIQTMGETDTLPLGSFGQLVQIILGVVAPGTTMVNVGGASIGAGAGAQSAHAVSSYKVGRIFGGSPIRQLVAQLVGVTIGSLLVVPVYAMVTRAYRIGSEALPAPAVLPWKAIAEVAAQGATMPRHAGLAVAVAIVAGSVLTLLEQTRLRRFLPSPIALGVAFVIPASNALTMVLGAFAGTLGARRWPIWNAGEGAAAAAGGIVGESVMGVVIAALIITGLL
jgi:uncharacterized oligopeptide transporter (OPT) family protein